MESTASTMYLPVAELIPLDADVEINACTELSLLSTEPSVMFTQACTLPLLSDTLVVSPIIVITR